MKKCTGQNTQEWVLIQFSMSKNARNVDLWLSFLKTK